MQENCLHGRVSLPTLTCVLLTFLLLLRVAITRNELIKKKHLIAALYTVSQGESVTSVARGIAAGRYYTKTGSESLSLNHVQGAERQLTGNSTCFWNLKAHVPTQGHTPSNKVTPPNFSQMVLSSRYPDIQRAKSVRGPFSFKPPQHANLQGNIWSIIVWDKEPAQHLLIKKYPGCICSVFISHFPWTVNVYIQ